MRFSYGINSPDYNILSARIHRYVSRLPYLCVKTRIGVVGFAPLSPLKRKGCNPTRVTVTPERLHILIMVIFVIKMKIGNSQCVYVIYNPRFNMVKVGLSNNPQKRVKELQGASGCELELIYATAPLVEPYHYESLIHKNFRDIRTTGEWFEGNLEEIHAYVIALCMEAPKEERVEMYLNGESVSVVADRMGISRQALVKYLKNVGIYKPAMQIIEKKRAKPTSPPKKEVVLDLPEVGRVRDVDFSTIKGEVYMSKNLYATKGGYLVKWWKGGDFERHTFSGKGELLAALGRDE